MTKQLECRVVITNRQDGRFDLGMYNPLNCRYEPLGTHPNLDRDKIIRGLKERIERERHLLTFSEVSAPR